MTDEDFETFVTTSDGKLADEDWFAVQLDEPAMVKRVLFAHGKTFPDGGWFDATAGKPRIQVKRTKDGPWETVAELSDYPATTAKDSAEMEGGESRHLQLARPGQGLGDPRHRQTGLRRQSATGLLLLRRVAGV